MMSSNFLMAMPVEELVPRSPAKERAMPPVTPLKAVPVAARSTERRTLLQKLIQKLRPEAEQSRPADTEQETERSFLSERAIYRFTIDPGKFPLQACLFPFSVDVTRIPDDPVIVTKSREDPVVVSKALDDPFAKSRPVLKGFEVDVNKLPSTLGVLGPFSTKVAELPELPGASPVPVATTPSIPLPERPSGSKPILSAFSQEVGALPSSAERTALQNNLILVARRKQLARLQTRYSKYLLNRRDHKQRLLTRLQERFIPSDRQVHAVKDVKTAQLKRLEQRVARIDSQRFILNHKRHIVQRLEQRLKSVQ